MIIHLRLCDAWWHCRCCNDDLLSGSVKAELWDHGYRANSLYCCVLVDVSLCACYRNGVIVEGTYVGVCLCRLLLLRPRGSLFLSSVDVPKSGRRVDVTCSFVYFNGMICRIWWLATSRLSPMSSVDPSSLETQDGVRLAMIRSIGVDDWSRRLCRRPPPSKKGILLRVYDWRYHPLS